MPKIFNLKSSLHIFLLLYSTQVVFALSCPPPNATDSAKQSDAVFSGQLISSNHESDYLFGYPGCNYLKNEDQFYILTFKVDEIFKGDAAKEIKIRSCGIPPAIGDYFNKVAADNPNVRWLVFADKSENDSMLEVGAKLCRINFLGVPLQWKEIVPSERTDIQEHILFEWESSIGELREGIKHRKIDCELLEAVSNNNLSKVEELVSKGANPNVRTCPVGNSRQTYSAFELALNSNRTNLSEMLFQDNFKLNLNDLDTLNFVRELMNNNTHESILLLLKKKLLGPDIDLDKYKLGEQLMYGSSVEFLERIFSYGFKPTKGMFYTAGSESRIDLINLMVSQPTFSGSREEMIYEGLRGAIRGEKLESARLLISLGADAKKGLNEAVSIKNPKLVDLLVESSKDYSGKS